VKVQACPQLRFLVAVPPVWDLLLSAKDLFGVAKASAVRPSLTYVPVGFMAFEGKKLRSQTPTGVGKDRGIQGRLRNRRCLPLARTAKKPTDYVGFSTVRRVKRNGMKLFNDFNAVETDPPRNLQELARVYCKHNGRM
jgi:hypothetical protein